jgi:hypothetical protein
MRAYKAADRDGSGLVTRKEFRFFLMFLSYYNNLWADFAAADGDDDRRITKEELVAANTKLNLGLPDAAKAFDEMDTNNGGFVLFDEFCTWMARESDRGADTPDAAESSDAKAPAAETSEQPEATAGDATPKMSESAVVKSEAAAVEEEREQAALKIQSAQRQKAARREADTRRGSKKAEAEDPDWL